LRAGAASRFPRAGPSTARAAPNQSDDMVDGCALLPLGFRRDRADTKATVSPFGGRPLRCAQRANWGPFTPPCPSQEIPKRQRRQGIGHFFGAMRIDALWMVIHFKRQIDDTSASFAPPNQRLAPTGPLIPGDPNARWNKCGAERCAPGFARSLKELRDISRKTGIPSSSISGMD